MNRKPSLSNRSPKKLPPKELNSQWKTKKPAAASKAQMRVMRPRSLPAKR